MVEMTGMLLFVCATSGTAGGLVNHRDRTWKGLMVSLVTAITVSLPIAWFYMWLALPNLNAGFLNNQLSVVMVAMIAGAAGATALKTAAKRFGLDLFEFPCEQGAKTTASSAEALQRAYNQQS